MKLQQPLGRNKKSSSTPQLVAPPDLLPAPTFRPPPTSSLAWAFDLPELEGKHAKSGKRNCQLFVCTLRAMTKQATAV